MYKHAICKINDDDDDDDDDDDAVKMALDNALLSIPQHLLLSDSVDLRE